MVKLLKLGFLMSFGLKMFLISVSFWYVFKSQFSWTKQTTDRPGAAGCKSVAIALLCNSVQKKENKKSRLLHSLEFLPLTWIVSNRSFYRANQQTEGEVVNNDNNFLLYSVHVYHASKY